MYWIVSSMVIAGAISALILWRMRLTADPSTEISPDGSTIVGLTTVAVGLLGTSFTLSDNAWGVHGPTVGVVAVCIGALWGLILRSNRDTRGKWHATALGAVIGGGSVFALYGAGAVMVMLVFAFVSL